MANSQFVLPKVVGDLTTDYC